MDQLSERFADLKLHVRSVKFRCDLCRSWQVLNRFSETLNLANRQHLWCNSCNQEYKTQYVCAMASVRKMELSTIQEIERDQRISVISFIDLAQANAVGKIDCMY